MYSAIMKLKTEDTTSIILNAADSYQGSLWYNFYKWKAIAHFFNKLPVDVQTLGNHEFDDGIEGLVPFIRGINAPTVVSNIDDYGELQFQNIYNKSAIITRFGRKIGVIGAVAMNTHETSRPGKLKFLNEVESINKEARRLQNSVDTIIVLSHCGYFVDQEIAKNAVAKIGLIVGGHSHSLLYNDAPPNNLTVEGVYPTVVTHGDGRKILIVQASAFTKFIANIRVRYNNFGNVISWSGRPIYLDESVPTDSKIDQEIRNWQTDVDEYGQTVLGRNLVLLDRTNCYNIECNIGNFIADAMVHAYSNKDEPNSWPYASIALINSGAIRNSINSGQVTVGDLLEAMPYCNTLDVAELKGKFIKDALEHAALVNEGWRNLLQVSGIQVVYNTTRPPLGRVVSLKVRCRECKISTYEDIQMETMYRVVLITFLVQGGDGYSSISDNLVNHKVGKVDQDAIKGYLVYKKTISQTIEGRIKFVK